MPTDGEEDCSGNTRDRHSETQCREPCPEVTVGSEEEERCARGHESGHTEYGDEEKWHAIYEANKWRIDGDEVVVGQDLFIPDSPS